jgi:hypothetical protein
MSSVAYANAPTFNDLPDVVVTDGALNNALGLTVDFNFFNYVNALRILDYVSDDDSNLSNVAKVGFQEATDDDNVLIGGEAAITAGLELDVDDWDNFVDKNTTGWPYLTIRDLIRSPTGGIPDPAAGGDAAFPDPTDSGGTPITDWALGVPASDVETILPWHNDEAQDGVLVDTDPQARLIALFVADEDNVISETMLIYSINNATNELSGAFTTLFETTFPPPNASDPLWFTQINGNGGNLASLTLTGNLTTGTFIGGESPIASGAGTVGTFLRYTTTTDPADTNNITGRIPFIEGNLIYEARYGLTLLAHSTTSGPADKQNAPDIRIGVLNANGHVGITTIINSSNSAGRGAVGAFDPQLLDVGTSREYKVHWDSHSNSPSVANLDISATLDGRTFHAFFDILDFDDQNNITAVGDEGEWRITSFSVGSITKPPTLGSGAPASRFYNIGNISAANGFATQDSSGSMSFVEDTPGAGDGTFNDLGGNNSGTAGFILKQKLEVLEWLTGITTRVTAHVSVPTAADRQNYKGFRLRHDQGFGNLIFVTDIQQNDSAGSGLDFPYVPVSRDSAEFTANGPTEQISYIDPYNGPGADFLALTLPAEIQLRRFHLSLDMVNSDAANAGVPGGANAVTVHDVIYELYGEL